MIEATHSERQTSFLVRTNGHFWDPFCEVRELSLKEIVLTYLGQPEQGTPAVLEESEHHMEDPV